MPTIHARHLPASSLPKPQGTKRQLLGRSIGWLDEPELGTTTQAEGGAISGGLHKIRTAKNPGLIPRFIPASP